MNINCNWSQQNSTKKNQAKHIAMLEVPVPQLAKGSLVEIEKFTLAHEKFQGSARFIKDCLHSILSCKTYY